MAKGKSKPRRPRRRPNPRIRQHDAALSMRPKRSSVPADPPVRSLTVEASGVIRLHICGTYETDEGGFTKLTIPSTRLAPCLLKSLARSKAYDVSCSDIVALIRHFNSLVSSTQLEFALRKVSVWGPVPDLNVGETFPTLSVDLGGATAGLEVSDRQSGNHRSRVGVSFPYTIWHPVSNAVIVRYMRGTDEVQKDHIMDLSVVWRISQTL